MKEGWFEGVDGTKLYYRTMGEGIPLILNDGIGCDGYAWKYFIDYFKDNFQIVHWQYKGHGRSDMPLTLDRVSIPDLARDLAKLCDLLELPPAVVLGHSMGVQVAFEFWHLFPEKTLGLIPVCGSYGNPLDTFHDNPIMKTVFPTMKKLLSARLDLTQPLWGVLADSELAYQIATRFEVNGRLVKREDFRPYFGHIAKVDVGLFTEMLAQAQDHDAKPYLTDINVPTLIVGGEKDTFTPMWLSREMKLLIAESELLSVPEGSHTAPIEMPELINLRVEKFLRDKVEPLVKAKKKAPAKKKAATGKKTVKSAGKKAIKTAAKKTKPAPKPRKKKAAEASAEWKTGE